MKSILQDWVMKMGLRQQGVLLSGLRGCDTVPKHHITKLVIRGLRADCLHSFNGDPEKAASYIKPLSSEQLWDWLPDFLDSFDDLPAHYVSHLIHAIQILAMYHPTRGGPWNRYYLASCKRWHMHPETLEDLEKRLNASEEVFAKQENDFEGD